MSPKLPLLVSVHLLVSLSLWLGHSQNSELTPRQDRGLDRGWWQGGRWSPSTGHLWKRESSHLTSVGGFRIFRGSAGTGKHSTLRGHTWLAILSSSRLGSLPTRNEDNNPYPHGGVVISITACKRLCDPWIKGNVRWQHRSSHKGNCCYCVLTSEHNCCSINHLLEALSGIWLHLIWERLEPKTGPMEACIL